MSCVIYGFVDYGCGQDEGVRLVFAEAFNIPNDKLLFCLMAGVRASAYISRGITPLFRSRGLPDDQWSHPINGLYLDINDQLAQLGVEGYCSEEQATKWVEAGIAEKRSDSRITDPDNHSFSYLYSDELEQVYDLYHRIGELDGKVLKAIIAAMRELEDGRARSRFVFWFSG